MNKKMRLTLVGVLVLILAGSLLWRTSSSNLSVDDFELVAVQRGDLVKKVTASGQINPVNVVTVGTQVSGIIEAIYVDFNDAVEQDEVLARLDTSVLQAEVDNSTTRLNRAQAQLKLAELRYRRVMELFEHEHIAEDEVDEASVQLDLAKEDVTAAQVQLERDKVNLGYATIKSPVPGVVIAREVDVGQTVAATFQTPELFLIAEDLSKMLIETSISEADIGMVQPGQSVSFTVDAYLDRTFVGEIYQIRLNPNFEQNVVTYNVIIYIENPDLLLLPGMTAFVEIAVAEKQDVLYVANSAWHYQPEPKLRQILDDIPTGTVVYVWRNNRVHVVPVQRGFSAWNSTEVISDQINEGDLVIIDSFLN